MKYLDYQKKLINNAEYQEAVKKLNYQFALGDAVLEARLRKGWSQTELARRAGTKQANISRIEAGMGNPTLDLIKRLCDVLDLEINFQIKGSEISKAAQFKDHKKIFEIYYKDKFSDNFFDFKNIFIEYMKENEFLYETESHKNVIDDQPILVANWPRKNSGFNAVPEVNLSTELEDE